MSDFAVDEQIVGVLRRITHAIDLWSPELQKRFGLTAPQLAVLRHVAAGELVSPTSLGEALHLSQPTVTGILQRLEDAGLIERRKSDLDRRSVVAQLTNAGQERLSQAPPLLRDQFRERLDALPDFRRTELLAALQLVADMLQAPEGEESAGERALSSVAAS